MKKVSIIVPVYNGERTIRRALESVRMQSSNNYELIVIDGNSSDNTKNIIGEYMDIIDYYVSEPDNGYSDALNKGIKVAKGEYSIILAADDFFLPDAIRLFEKNIHNDTEVFCGNMFVLKEMGILVRFKRVKNVEELEKCKVVAHPATFFKVNSFEKYGYYDPYYKVNADTELVLRFHKNGAKFQFDDSFISVFTYGGMSTSFDIKEQINSLKDKSQAEEVAIKYGMSSIKAHLLLKYRIIRKSAIVMLKKLVRNKKIMKTLYIIVGQKPLSYKEITRYRIPKEFLVNY